MRRPVRDRHALLLGVVAVAVLITVVAWTVEQVLGRAPGAAWAPFAIVGAGIVAAYLLGRVVYR